MRMGGSQAGVVVHSTCETRRACQEFPTSSACRMRSIRRNLNGQLTIVSGLSMRIMGFALFEGWRPMLFLA